MLNMVNKQKKVEKTQGIVVPTCTTRKRRNRKKKIQSLKNLEIKDIIQIETSDTPPSVCIADHPLNRDSAEIVKMSSKEEILAAREAKKLAKQGKKKNQKENASNVTEMSNELAKEPSLPNTPIGELSKSKDEVDKATVKSSNIDKVDAETSNKNKDKIKAERAAKKAAKQAKNKVIPESDGEKPNPDKDMTVKDVVETLKDIVNVAKEIKEVTAKVSAMKLEGAKTEETGKSKAELRAERRAKQEAQRAAKQGIQEKPVQTKATDDMKQKSKPIETVKLKEEKTVKQKTPERLKAKLQRAPTINWFQQLQTNKDKEILKNMAINSNLHPAIVKLAVQLSTRVVTGSNARCIAFLDALKKMVRDYNLPAKTEFSRGLEAALTTSVNFLWAARAPAASQINALKFFRYQLTQLPNNVDEFDAKKQLQEEIDRYIREQIDKAGEAISIAVRQKISDGDNILTYGCSSLIERILREAWQAGVRFRAVVVGNRHRRDAAEMLRRLVACGVPCSYYDITAIHFVMPTVALVVVGGAELLADGGVVCAAGSAAVALAARAHNVPALVACRTHQVAPRVRTPPVHRSDAGDPDDLVDKNDENSPLKDWRSNPNLTLVNLAYDVTPPSLITAVVTDLAILPCTSAPVVLRFKLSEYGI